MSPIDFRPPHDEPPCHDARLLVFVNAARAEPPPVVGIDAQAIYAGWQQQRTRRWRGVAAGLAVAAVVLAVGLWSFPREGTVDPRTDHAMDHVVVNEAPASPSTIGSVNPGPAPDTTKPEPVPVLAASIHVSPLEPTTSQPQVLGPRKLRLAEGGWSIDSETDELVEVLLPDGALELRGGSVLVQVAGDVAHVEVRRDHVLRVDAQGHFHTLRPKSPEPEPTAAGSSPAELARKAEAQMVAGDRAGAIRTLGRLVTRHGRSPAARAGLIDLGRLLKAAGRTDEARCAYATFLARWPAHALAGDVARARAALGEGPACDGLRPHR